MIAVLAAFVMAAPAPADPAVFAITEDINGGEADAFVQLAKWAERGGAKEIVVVINSNGGNALESLRLFVAVMGSPLPTRCEVRGTAASGAFVVLQACNVRTATKTSKLVTHRVRARLSSPFVTVEQAKDMAQDLSDMSDAMDTSVALRLRMPLDAYRKRIAGGEDWTMTPAQALKHGAIDGVLNQ